MRQQIGFAPFDSDVTNNNIDEDSNKNNDETNNGNIITDISVENTNINNGEDNGSTHSNVSATYNA